MLVVALLAFGAVHYRGRSVRAQDVARFEVDFDAPASCPSRATFESRLRSRLPQSADPARRLRVRIELTSQGVRGEIALEQPPSPPQTRAIEARTCAEAVDALALIAAMLLDPLGGGGEVTDRSAIYAEDPVPEQTADGTRNQSSPQPKRERPRPNRGRERAIAASREEPPSLPVEEERSADGGETEKDEEPTEREGKDDGEALEAPADAGPAPQRAGAITGLSLTGSGLLVSGVAPRLRPGVAIGALLTVSASARRGFAARAGARLALKDESTSTDGAAELRWWSTHLNACAHMTVASFSFLPCAVGEIGRLAAAGSRAEAPRTSQRLWSAAGLSLGLVWQFSRTIGLILSGESLMPLVRDRYLLGRDVVHSVPALTIRGELGVSVRLM